MATKEELKVEIKVDSSDATKNVKKTKEEIEELEKRSEAASDAVDEAFDNIKETTKTAMAGVGAAIGAAVAAMVGLAESTRDYRNEQAKLITAFESAGSSAETAGKVYDELNGILGESDSAVEAANHLAKLTNSEEELAELTDICTGVYAEFGDSLDIPGFTEAINHSVKLGKVQGTLADALEWSGISAEEFDEELEKCTTEEKRQEKIVKTLNGLYKDSAKRFKENNKEIIESNKASEKWNKSLSKMGGYIEPIITDVKEMGAALLDDAAAPMEEIATYISDELLPNLTDIAKWISDNREMILATIATATSGIVAFEIASYSAKLAEEGLTIATVAHTAAQKALNAIMNAAPYMLVIGAITALTTGVIAHVKEIEREIEEAGKLNEEQQKLVDTVNATTDAIKAQNEAYEETSSGINSHMDYVSDLADELFRLGGESGKVKEADEARVKFILNELNEALGTEYKMVDGVIQQYNTLKDTIYKTIDAKKANLLLEANQEQYVEAIKNQNQALQDVNTSYDAYMDQMDKAEKKKAEYAEEYEKASEKLENAVNAQDWLSGWYYGKEVERIQGLIDAEDKKVSDMKANYDKAVDNYAGYTNDIERYENASAAILKENYDEAVDILDGKGVAYGDYADTVDEETQKVLDTLYDEAIQTGVEAKRIKSNYENGVKGYTKKMVEESEKAHTDAMNEWEDAYDEAHGIGGDVGDGLKEGMESKKLGLLQKARNLISSIWNAMRSEADSHSPSRKTMALGGDMGAGLEIGMEDSTDDVVKSAETMVRKSLIPFTAAIDGITWNNISGAFGGKAVSMGLIANSGINRESIVKNNAKSGGSPSIIQLVVDKRVLGQVSAEGINDITKQTGNIPLVVM